MGGTVVTMREGATCPICCAGRLVKVAADVLECERRKCNTELFVEGPEGAREINVRDKQTRRLLDAQRRRAAGPIPASRLFPADPLPLWRVRLEWSVVALVIAVSMWAGYELFVNH